MNELYNLYKNHINQSQLMLDDNLELVFHDQNSIEFIIKILKDGIMAEAHDLLSELIEIRMYRQAG